MRASEIVTVSGGGSIPVPSTVNQAVKTDNQSFSSGGNTGTHNLGLFDNKTHLVFSIELSWLASASSLGGTLTEPFQITINDNVASVELISSTIWCPPSAGAFAFSDRVIMTWANGYLLQTPVANSTRLIISWANTVTNWAGAGVNVNSIVTYS